MLCHPTLSANAQRLCAFLIARSDVTTGQYFVGEARLSAMLNIPERTLRRAKVELRNAGVLKWQKHAGPKGTALYTVDICPLAVVIAEANSRGDEAVNAQKRQGQQPDDDATTGHPDGRFSGQETSDGEHRTGQIEQRTGHPDGRREPATQMADVLTPRTTPSVLAPKREKEESFMNERPVPNPTAEVISFSVVQQYRPASQTPAFKAPKVDSDLQPLTTLQEKRLAWLSKQFPSVVELIRRFPDLQHVIADSSKAKIESAHTHARAGNYEAAARMLRAPAVQPGGDMPKSGARE